MDTLEYGVVAVAVVGIALGLYGALVPNLGRLRLPSFGAGEDEEQEDAALGALREDEIRDLEEEIDSLDDGTEEMDAELGPASRAPRRGRGLFRSFSLRRRRRPSSDEEDEAEGEEVDEEAGSALQAQAEADVDAEAYEDDEEAEDARPAARLAPQPAAEEAAAESEAAAPAAAEAISPSGTPETEDDLLAIFRDSAQQGGAPAAVRESLEHVSIQELLAEARAVHALFAGADADEE